jgi:hypothetical protein
LVIGHWSLVEQATAPDLLKLSPPTNNESDRVSMTHAVHAPISGLQQLQWRVMVTPPPGIETWYVVRMQRGGIPVAYTSPIWVTSSE